EHNRDDDAREAMQGIGLTSPFLEWKLLLRGLYAFYREDNERALENWSRLDTTRLPARIAAPLRANIDPAFAAAQPPATQQVLRRQADRLTSNAAVAGLRSVQEALVKAGGHLAPVFRQAETVLPLLKAQHPELVSRFARCLYWEIIDQGVPDDLKRYQRL